MFLCGCRHLFAIYSGVTDQQLPWLLCNGQVIFSLGPAVVLLIAVYVGCLLRALTALSQSGTYKAVLRKVLKKGEQKQFLEVRISFEQFLPAVHDAMCEMHSSYIFWQHP